MSEVQTPKEGFWHPDKPIDLPPLHHEFQPSRATIEQTPLIPELFLKPDLPQHGIYHGAAVEVLVNVVYKMLPPELQEKINREVLDRGALYHDCGRKKDYGYHTREMQTHGPRGADIVHEKWPDQDLDPQTKELLEYLIRDHTPTHAERKAKQQNGKNLAALSAKELTMMILQDADHADLTRGFYATKPGTDRLTPLAAGASQAVRSAQKVSGLFARRSSSLGLIERGLILPETRALYPYVSRLAWKSRHDPEIQLAYPHDPRGATLEAAEQIGLITA